MIYEKRFTKRDYLFAIRINGKLLSISSGTTVFELARCLQSEKRVIVITPALRVTLELCNRPHIEILQLGGLIHHRFSSAAGSFAERIPDEFDRR